MKLKADRISIKIDEKTVVTGTLAEIDIVESEKVPTGEAWLVDKKTGKIEVRLVNLQIENEDEHK